MTSNPALVDYSFVITSSDLQLGQLNHPGTIRVDKLYTFPVGFPEDAPHVAVAAVNGIEYLPTWNYKPLANAGMRGEIEAACRELGYEAMIICSPEELMEA
jgi:hypothetical protein